METSRLEEKLQLLHIEYNRKKRRLKKSRRSSEARSYVQQKLQEFEGKKGFGSLDDEDQVYSKAKNDVESLPSVSYKKSESELNEHKSEIEADLVLSPVEPVNNLEIDVDLNGIAEDERSDVLLLECCVQTASKQRGKCLKLAKYKKKNYANPLPDDHNVSAHNLDGKTLLPDTKTHQDLSSDNTGVNYSQGQVIIIDQNMKQSELDNPVVVSNSCGSFLKSDITLNSQSEGTNCNLDSFSQISVKSSVHNELDDFTNCENTKMKRKSSGRKRRLSGIEGQRRSSRISNTSSQDLTSCNETVISPASLARNRHCFQKTIILSSVFQCLVDEGKRQPQTEFSINLDSSVCNFVCKPGDSAYPTTTCINSEDLFESNKKNEADAFTSDNMDINDVHKKLDVQDCVGETSESVDTEGKKFDVQVNEILKINSMNGLSSVVENFVEEVEEVKSPTLFESQTLVETFDSYRTDDNVKSIFSDRSEVNIETDNSEESQSFRRTEKLVTERISDIEKVSSHKHLKPLSSFQVPSSDQIHSVCCGEVTLDNEDYMFVVCLCSTCLKLYTCTSAKSCKFEASTKIPFTIRKKSSNVMYALNNSEAVNIILLEPKTNCTVMYCYSYRENSWEQTVVDKIFCKSLTICPLSDMKMVVSYLAEKKTYLTRYFVDVTSGQWSSIQMGNTDSHVLGLMTITGIESAVVALTESLHIQIWNHEQGFCLTSIDISDVCPVKPLCPQVYSEQGFLFLPIISAKKGAQAGSVIVVNPFLGTSETLSAINVDDVWTGTNKVTMMLHDLILCRQSNGCIRVWNLYTGNLVAVLDDVTVSSFSSKNNFLVVAHKQCVHSFILNAPCDT